MNSPVHLETTAIPVPTKHWTSSAIFKWIFAISLAVSVGYALVHQSAKLDWSTLHFKPLPLIGSAIALIIIYANRAIWFRVLLRGYGSQITWRQAAVVGWLPQLGKYIPGQIWALGGAMKFLRGYGVPGPVALGALLVMDGLLVVTGLITGAPLLLWHPIVSRYPTAWVWCALVVITGLVCLHPRIYGKLLNTALRKLKRAPLPSLPPARDYIGPVLLGFLQWLLAGASLWLITRSITTVDWRTIHLFMAISALGYTAGYLSPFPGGLGPRDAIFQVALTFILPNAAAASVVVIAIRLLQTLVEVGVAILGWSLIERRREASAQLST